MSRTRHLYDDCEEKKRLACPRTDHSNCKDHIQKNISIDKNEPLYLASELPPDELVWSRNMPIPTTAGELTIWNNWVCSLKETPNWHVARAKLIELLNIK